MSLLVENQFTALPPWFDTSSYTPEQVQENLNKLNKIRRSAPIVSNQPNRSWFCDPGLYGVDFFSEIAPVKSHLTALLSGKNRQIILIDGGSDRAQVLGQLRRNNLGIFEEEYLELTKNLDGYDDAVCYRTTFEAARCGELERSFLFFIQLIEKVPSEFIPTLFADSIQYYLDRLIQEGYSLDNFIRSKLSYNFSTDMEYPPLGDFFTRKYQFLTYPGYLRNGNISFDMIDGVVNYTVLEGYGRQVHLFGDVHIRQFFQPCSGKVQVNIVDLLRIAMEAAKKEGRVLDIYLEEHHRSLHRPPGFYQSRLANFPYIYQIGKYTATCLGQQCYWPHRIHAIDVRANFPRREDAKSQFISALFDIALKREGHDLTRAYAIALPYLTRPINDIREYILVSKKLQDQLDHLLPGQAQYLREQVEIVLEGVIGLTRMTSWEGILGIMPTIQNMLFNGYARMVDLMMAARILRSFDPIPGRYSEEQRSVIVYVGNAHLLRTVNYLVGMGMTKKISLGMTSLFPTELNDFNQCQPVESKGLFSDFPVPPAKDPVYRTSAPLILRQLRLLPFASAYHYPYDFPYTPEYVKHLLALPPSEEKDRFLKTVANAYGFGKIDEKGELEGPYRPLHFSSLAFDKNYKFVREPPIFNPIEPVVAIVKDITPVVDNFKETVNPSYPPERQKQSQSEMEHYLRISADRLRRVPDFVARQAAQYLDELFSRDK